jgi:hypothetical protein
MAAFVVRLWLPDRPGALGSVASRIGAVRGDLVGIDILERGAGRAIDELVVELPSAALVPLLVQEIHEVEGVDVEEVRAVGEGGRLDPRVAALETAAALLEPRTASEVLRVLVERAVTEFDATWAAVTDGTTSSPSSVVVTSAGDAPPDAWVAAFAGGVGRDGDEGGFAGDVAYGPLARSTLTLVVGRPGRPWRRIECRQLAALAGVADVRCVELRGRALPEAALVRSPRGNAG